MIQVKNLDTLRNDSLAKNVLDSETNISKKKKN